MKNFIFEEPQPLEKQKQWSRLGGGSESEVQNKPELRKEERETGRQTALGH